MPGKLGSSLPIWQLISSMEIPCHKTQAEQTRGYHPAQNLALKAEVHSEKSRAPVPSTDTEPGLRDLARREAGLKNRTL